MKALKLKRDFSNTALSDDIVEIKSVFTFGKNEITYYLNKESDSVIIKMGSSAETISYKNRILLDYQVSFLTLRNIGYWCQ